MVHHRHAQYGLADIIVGKKHVGMPQLPRRSPLRRRSDVRMKTMNVSRSTRSAPGATILSQIPISDWEEQRLRKVTFGVANSLDNYIARHDHGIDWILGGEEALSAITEFWKKIETVAVGRKTLRTCAQERQALAFLSRRENLCLFAHDTRKP